jgi:hypothetical protein
MAEPQKRAAEKRYGRTAPPGYLIPLVALLIVAGVLLLLWVSRGGVAPEADNPSREIERPVGAAGGGPEGPTRERGDTVTPSGVQDRPGFDDTADELQYRTGNPDPPAFPGTQPGADVSGAEELEDEPARK